MRIVVISDTHAQSLSEIPAAIVNALGKADLIVHAGDFTAKAVLDELRLVGSVKAVAGNMDSAEVKKALPPQELFVINGKKIGLIHGWGAPWGIAHRVREQFDDVEIIIYGHSHQPDNQYIRGSLLFNPGQAKNSFGLLTISDKITAEIIRV